MLHNGSVISRRRFLSASAAAPVGWPAWAASADSAPGLRLEYAATAPPKVPSPLDVRSPARIVVEIGGSGAGGRCCIGLQVLLDQQPCLLPLALWTGDTSAYLRHREVLRLPAYPGRIGNDGNGWSLSVDGRAAYSARTAGSIPETRGSSRGLPWVTYRHTLHPDWRQGPLDGPSELWMLPSAAHPRPGDLGVEEVTASGSLDGWLTRLGAVGPVAASAVDLADLPFGEFVREVDAHFLEPFALRKYPGAAAQAGASDPMHLSAADLASYRGRREHRLSGIMLVAVDASVSRDSVEPILPPPCEAPETAVVRVMAVRGLDDPGLDEAWLFANCLLEGRRAWYAASHVRGTFAGSEFGREVLGYPTRAGSVAATVGASQFSASITQGGAGLCFATGFYGGFSTGTSLADMSVVTLRLGNGAGGGNPKGEIMVQPWRFQGLRMPIRRESLHTSFPPAERGSRATVWNRMGPANAYWALVFDSATMQRLPAAVIAEIENPAPYYRDRCGGRLPWVRTESDEDRDASD